MKEPFNAPPFYVFMSKKKNICKKVDQKPKRAVYANEENQHGKNPTG